MDNSKSSVPRELYSIKARVNEESFPKDKTTRKINNLEEEIRWPLEMHPSLQGEVSFIDDRVMCW